MSDISELNSYFHIRRGSFGQEYTSARFEDKEVTIDNLIGDYRLCICTPYNERKDRKKLGSGAGEVVMERTFNNLAEVLEYLVRNEVML